MEKTLITAEGCRGRRQRLLEHVDGQPDCILLGAPRNLALFTGFYASPFSYSSQNAQALLAIFKDGRSALVVDNILEETAKSAYADEVVVANWSDGRRSLTARSTSLVDAARKFLRNHAIEKFRIDSGVPENLFERPIRGAERPKTLSVDRAIMNISRSKAPDELAVMRKSLEAMGAGYAAGREQIHAGMTELEAYTVVHRAATLAAGQPVTVYGDFASGPRAESGGGGPTGRVIDPGDLFILDYSVILQGYRGDCASTWVIDGEPSPRQREISVACLEAMAAGEAILKHGAWCREADAAVRSVLRDHGLEPYFTHHSGHGLGLGHPDPPYIVPESNDRFIAGDVVTLEPGCYIPGVAGMRFEHNYLITDDGFERLSHHRLGLT